MSLIASELHDVWNALRGSNGLREEALAAVRIRRLRGIRDLEFRFGYPVQVLAGPNGCGKSTVLFACACAYRAPGRGPRDFAPSTLFPNFSSRQASVSSDEPQPTELEFYYLHRGTRFSMTWKRGRSWKRGFPSRNGRSQPERQVYLRTLANFTNRSEVRGASRPASFRAAARIFLDRDDASGDVLLAPRYRDIFQRALYGQSRDQLSVLCEDAVAEGFIRGVFDMLNVETGLRHEDLVIGRNTGRDEFAGHLRTLGKFERLTEFVFVLDGDSRGLESTLKDISREYGGGVQPLFLPGDGPPERWMWDTLREKTDDYAAALGRSAADLGRSMRSLERLLGGAVRRRDGAKAAFRALAHDVGRTAPELARIVGQKAAASKAMPEFVAGLKEQIARWRRL